jgi:catechol 2,3-dioxygenase-like lactoylglutathione lyase family enzyme
MGIRKIGFAALALAVGACWAAETTRPKISGIVQVRILTSDEAKAKAFYYGIFGTLAKANMPGELCDWCETAPINDTGPVALEPVSGPLPKDLIDSVALRTDDVEGLRKLLQRNQVEVGKLTKWQSGASFGVSDPEGHKLIFVQAENSPAPDSGMPGAYVSASSRWPPIIHAGFIVKNRETMDHFYKDILGFHVYWHGGMKDDETNWVDMQVPDGKDWIEYMLNVPENADQHTRGVMNHIAVGVSDVRAADKLLLEGRIKLPLNEPPKVGRDGKWQLNLYDPDGTRVEMMEFTPVQKPCCSEYTGKHPGP